MKLYWDLANYSNHLYENPFHIALYIIYTRKLNNVTLYQLTQEYLNWIR